MARPASPLVLGLAAALALGACSWGAEDPVKDPSASSAVSLTFDTCPPSSRVDPSYVEPERYARLVFECATLSTPLDHANPEGEKLDMAVVRVRSREPNPDRTGSLLLIPGGPGEPGLPMLGWWASWFSDEILDHFDLVTFDPRGTGSSAPINCAKVPEDDQPARTWDLLGRRGFARVARTYRHLTDACLQRLGDRAPYFNTTETARDLDLLREALGDDKLTALGWSYGAKLGAEYARAFPDRVRALVLDAPSDSAIRPIDVAARQVHGFESSLGEWAAQCPDRPGCPDSGDPVRFVRDLVAAADRRPIPSSRSQDALPATGSTVLDAVAATLRDGAAWWRLDAALVGAAEGDAAGLFEGIEHVFGPEVPDEPDQPDMVDANYVINCNDLPPGPTVREIRTAARRLVAENAVFARWGSWLLFGCRGWQPERTPLADPEAPGAPPIVVVGTVHDPATPYVGAVHIAEVLGSGHLLTWGGQGHTAYGTSDCVTELADEYLVTLVLPEEGTRCPAEQ